MDQIDIDIGADVGANLPVPDFSRFGRWASGRINDAGEFVGGMYDQFYGEPAPEPAPEPDASKMRAS